MVEVIEKQFEKNILLSLIMALIFDIINHSCNLSNFLWSCVCTHKEPGRGVQSVLSTTIQMSDDFDHGEFRASELQRVEVHCYCPGLTFLTSCSRAPNSMSTLPY